MSKQIGMGTLQGVPLFFDVNSDRFVPLGIVEDDGASDAGILLTQIKQPTSNGSVSQLEPSAQSSLNDEIGNTSTQRNLLMTLAVPYGQDPEEQSFGQDILGRNSAGLLATGSTGENPLLAERRGLDVRSWLYATDEDTTTQGIRLLATAAGLLKVEAAPSIAPNLTTTADFTTTAATTTQALAANTARRFAIVQNVDATDSVRVGDSNTGAARGIVLAPGESVTFETTAAISVFPVANTPAVSLIEITD